MILVTDANVWIDLDNGGLTTLVFDLPYDFVSPDVVIHELGPELAVRLLNQGLTSHSTDPEAEETFSTLRALYRHPSDEDLYALLLAMEQQWGLLTGDRQLREAAEKHGLKVHGLLWVLDELVDAALFSRREAAETLQKILDDGARLPTSECAHRLLLWNRRD